MKSLNITWDDGVPDTTGYLFSFAKSLAVAVRSSPYGEIAEDIIATSGFAFRMWVSADQLCPSGTSIWRLDAQKSWVENGGLLCHYVGRYWGQEEIEEQKRRAAIAAIRESIDSGIPAISWDIGLPQWGLITGYDEGKQLLETLSITGERSSMAYGLLGKQEVPMLSVLTIAGRTDKTRDAILRDTIQLAKSHLKGEEWCENAHGLSAYPALIRFFEDRFDACLSWNMLYYLGTYCALKYYAYRYFEKYELGELTSLYKSVYENWQTAFNAMKWRNDSKEKIASALKAAQAREIQALARMEEM